LLQKAARKGIAFRGGRAHSEIKSNKKTDRITRLQYLCKTPAIPPGIKPFSRLPFPMARQFSTREHRRLHMNLTISGHHLEVTPALRNYVTSKLDRITRHFDQVVDVKVILTVEKQKEKERRQRAECNIHVKGSDMFAECAHEDLYAAVDELVDKLDRQVVRHKDKLQNHHHAAPKRLM